MTVERSSKRAEAEAPSGVSAFVARVLDQLSLSAWVPSALLTLCLALLLQFRAQRSVDLAAATTALTKDRGRFLLLVLPVHRLHPRHSSTRL